jgi:hypothetical protein
MAVKTMKSTKKLADIGLGADRWVVEAVAPNMYLVIDRKTLGIRGRFSTREEAQRAADQVNRTFPRRRT